jgi:hypothetical protein
MRVMRSTAVLAMLLVARVLLFAGRWLLRCLGFDLELVLIYLALDVS